MVISTSLSSINETIEKFDLSLIVPTYNESSNIPQLIARTEKSLSKLKFQLIVVDDNSPDGTAKTARALNSIYENITVCVRKEKLGLSSAILHGFESAKADVLAVIDADMQHPPEILPKMYMAIAKGSDLVVASRYAAGGGIEKWTFTRKLYSIGAITIAHLLLPDSRKVKDIMSGCFMVRKQALKNADLTPIGFKILLEILCKCRFNRITEVPYTFTSRLNGESHMKQKEIQDYIVHLTKLFYQQKLVLKKEKLGFK